MTQDTDPVGNEFVASLAARAVHYRVVHPCAGDQREATGASNGNCSETFARVAVLGTSSNPGNAQALKQTELVAERRSQ